MIETQGRRTLHTHLLVWLKRVPSSTVELENRLNGPDGHLFQQCVVAYVKSIVSNNLLLPVEESSCVKFWSCLLTTGWARHSAACSVKTSPWHL
ncbi:hypothetical protein JG687_00006739 [Phytophthora cactorum]|uniref:Helitron helicase-like domain-containing protein n=1 Tax=Phytophthora cactorum TaxID=29920 RepID=A0A8T1UIS3_9STRA|nr:hypothetical protein JG687_00006739 [Phytophthora cactorum]